MDTPWGEIEVRDAHAHLFSSPFFESLARERGQPGEVDALVRELGWEAPPSDPTGLAARWTRELDRYGVARSVLMSSVPGDEDSASALVRARPDRFYGYFMFNPFADDPLGRARRAFDDLGLQGLCLFPAMHGFSVQDARLAPIYALAAERRNVIVFVHMGVLTVGVRKKLGLRSRFDMRFSNPLDLHRVALEHPDLTFVIPHFGAGYFRDVLMLGDLAGNVCLDTSSTNRWIRYALPDITLRDVFRKAIEVFGPERLLFGSDSSFFPRGWNREVFDTQVAVLEEIGADVETARAVFGDNLKRLLGG
jgi:hypothetical protein